MNNIINYSSDVARLLTKGYGSISEPIYVDNNGQILIATNVLAGGSWTTARTLTIGSTGKTVDGSADVSWSKAEILDSSTDANFYRGDQTWSNILNGTFTANGDITANGGYLKSTVNSNTITIGSQNSSFTHIYNSANIGFIFNNTVATTTGDLGTATYPWNNIYIGKANGAGIYYAGTQNTYRMIRFIDNTADTYGNGISIGGGGLVAIGGGESADTLLSNLSLTAAGGTENTYIGADGTIFFFPDINSWDAAAQITMTAGRLWAGVNGNTTRENLIGVQSGSGQIYMWSSASTTGNRGIYVTAHGSGSARAAITVGTNNEIYYADGYNGTSTRLAYSQAALAASAITWLTCWNGYELRAISKAEMAAATDSAHKWTRLAGDTMSGTLAIVNNTQNNGTYNALLYVLHNSNNDWGAIITKGSSCDYGLQVTCKSDGSYGVSVTGRITGTKVYGAVWNDYAECRNVNENIMPGQVVYETSSKTMKLANKRLQAGCRVVSDTYGMCIGETEDAKIPVAVCGRVLVYPYRNREQYELGAAVCSAPNGTVDIMTREEIRDYPERIIGTISEIPDYEIWHAGERDGNHDIQVKGRIWIYVR